MAITVGTLATLLTTELNALASGSYSAAGSTVQANRTDLNMYADFELAVTFASAPTVGNTVDLYVIPKVDNTNYADGGGAITPPATYYAGSFVLRAVTTAQRVAIMGASIPPDDFKLVALNSSGVAFPASGSTVKISPYKIG